MLKHASKTTPVTGGAADVPVDCKNCGAYQLCMSLWLKTGDSSLLERVVKKKQVFKRGELLYHMGQPVDYMYVIRGGSVKTSVSTEDGQVQVIGFHEEGELLGLNAIESRQYSCEARAMRVTSVCEVSIERFEELAGKDPAIQHEVLKIMSAEIRLSHELLLLLGKHNAEERLAIFLLRLSQQFARRHCSPTEFNLSMSRSDIGNHLGIAEETVCRILARFQDDGIISSECRHIKLNDMRRLQQIANLRPIEQT